MDWLGLLNNVVAPLLGALSGKYGIIMQVISVMGTLRVVFKPLMLGLQFYVTLTPDPSDNVWLSNFMGSKWYAVIQFLIDWVASIKLPAPPTDNPPPPATGG